MLKKILTLKNMKTSNKLLISLAISLILIPIIVIAVNVRINYMDKKAALKENKKEEHFNTPSYGYISEKINKSFNAVEILDGKGLALDIVLIQEDNTGLKISEEFKNLISYNVDDNGKLQISFKGSVEQKFRRPQLYIYAPNIVGFAASRGNSLSLWVSKRDSLNLKASKIGSFWLNTDSKFNNLSLLADSVNNINLDKTSINSLNLNLINSNFKTSASSYKTLSIKALGNSNIEIDGDENNKDKYSINDLSIKTEGKSTITLTNIKTNKTSGSLSDSTYVLMPATSLKQMFKN
ncbi:hypothetical protein D7004_19895 [Pedobacter jejuensis]|uniref:Uncharacterized protein n=2 Tax=Pedobacter jejuensis TaxID=1268550 RepID=A0A3N0BLU8_9SPHI|nr:hypothetical protein D7004_19895 [Pedobacter jejuensis]